MKKPTSKASPPKKTAQPPSKTAKSGCAAAHSGCPNTWNGVCTREAGHWGAHQCSSCASEF